MKKIWTENEISFAEEKLNEIVNKINNYKIDGQDLTMFEKFLLAYKFVTSFRYNRETELENSDDSRTVEGIFNTGKIVCAGYAVLLKKICDRLNIPCIEQNALIVYQCGNTFEIHGNNLVYIKDEKYNIDGIYYCDACWDGLKKSNPRLSEFYSPDDNYQHFLWCLMPYDDPKEYCGNSEIVYYPGTEYGDLGGITDINDATVVFAKHIGLTEQELGSIRKHENLDIISSCQEKTRKYIYSKAKNSKPITPSQFYKGIQRVGVAIGLRKETAEHNAYETMLFNSSLAKEKFNLSNCHSCFVELIKKHPEITQYNNENGVINTIL